MLTTSLLTRAWCHVKTWNAVSRQRRELLKLSDHMLKDLGLSRADAERESRRPFWENGPNRDRTLRRSRRSDESCQGEEMHGRPCSTCC